MNESEAKKDRRLFPRRDFRTKVVFENEYGEGIFYLYSVDLSLGGMFLESDVPLEPGSLLFVSFTLPKFKRPLHITAEVVRLIELADESRSGVGIRWLGFNEGVLNKLKEFLVEG